jgi:hypothetical protein
MQGAYFVSLRAKKVEDVVKGGLILRSDGSLFLFGGNFVLWVRGLLVLFKRDFLSNLRAFLGGHGLF